MRPPIPAALWRLDQHLVENHPVLWILRMHWMAFVWLVGIGLIALAALAFPLTARTLGLLDVCFVAVLVPAALVWISWAQDQLRVAAQIRQIRPARAGIYLLAGSLFLSALLLAWPYAFVAIVEAKITARAGREDVAKARSVIDEVREEKSGRVEVHPVGLPRCVMVENRLLEQWVSLSEEEADRVREFQRLFERFGMRAPGEPLPARGRAVSCADALRIRISYFGDAEKITAFQSIAAIAGVEGREERSSEPRVEGPEVFITLAALLLAAVLFLRILESTGARSFLPAVVALGAVLALLALAPPALSLAGNVLLSLIGAFAVFCALRWRRRAFWIAAGLHLFTFVGVSAPVWAWAAGRSAPSALANSWDLGIRLLLGVALLLLLTPWIQRAYIAYRAAPE